MKRVSANFLQSHCSSGRVLLGALVVDHVGLEVGHEALDKTHDTRMALGFAAQVRVSFREEHVSNLLPVSQAKLLLLWSLLNLLE